MEEKMDNHLQYSRKWKKSLTAGILLALALGGTGYAMPTGGQIQSGQGSIAQNGKNMTVTQNSGKMAVDWTQFNIARDEAVKFAQPGRDAVALNRITGGQKSVIDGALSANGNLFLVNPNGVVFGKTSTVDVGSLVASTAQLNDSFMKNFASSTANLNLTIGDGNSSAILNEGSITAQGGLVALHAAQVENTGTISNAGGQVALAAAKQLTLSPDSDGKLNYAVDGELAQAKALNSGRIQADGGYVVMTAKSADDVLGTVVNNTGTIEARTLRKDEKGQILLDGGQSGQVEVSGTLDASGTDEGQSAGSIKVIGQKTLIHDNTSLLAKGNVDGGKIETSGDVLNLGDGLTIDAGGVNGKHGEWLLDPLEILIQDDQPIQSSMDQTVSTVNGGSETQITYNDPPSATQNANATYSSTSWIKTKLITDILNKGTDVTIQAASTSQATSITVNSAIKPKVEGDGEASLTLEAQRNITINKEIAADESGGKLNVKLNSDTDGDGVGAVIINADISTNGGTFTSGSGGNVKFDGTQKDGKGNTIYETTENGKVKEDSFGNKIPKYLTAGYSSGGKYSGTANIQGHTVGTYFGYVTPAGKTVTEYSESRNITTNGGDINLYGEVAIGLNGGTLSLDTSKTDGTGIGGALNITGIINSGNSYTDYIYGTDAWNQLVSNLVKEYIEAGTVPSYHFVGIYYTKNADGTYSYTTTPHDFKKNETHYAFQEFTSGDVVGFNWTHDKTKGTLDTQDTRWYTTNTAGKGYNSFIMEATTPTTSQMSINDWLIYYRRTDPNNYATKYADGNANNLVTYDQIKDNTAKMANLRSDISALLAHNWYASEDLAKSGTGANPGDSYLTTITTALENSLSTPNSQKTLWVGARGSGVQNKTNDKIRVFTHTPADPTHPDGFYWVTGPEGLVTTTVTNADGTTTIEGTKFWDTSSSDWTKNNYGSQVYGYTKWSSWSGGGQPDNSAPFLTVGYGNNNAWDDASVGGETTVGFVQETNLYNSSLNVKTAGGKVTLQGDIGKSVGLDTVKIDAGTGPVSTGNTENTATKYNNGTIYADHGVYINGGEVTVGGEIHSGGTNVEATKNTDDSFKDYLDNVTIQSSGNLTVHGIEVNASTDHSGNTSSRTDGEGGKIKLVSTGTEGVITLGDGVDYNGKNTNGGVLKAASTAQGAVVIDAQGSNGGFVNKTSADAEKAIDTGENGTGTWQIYSASPDKDIFGTNLNSGTDAQWTSKSASNTIATENKYGKNPNRYSDTSNNKFIFQATPVITLYSEDYLKTYGDEVSADTLNKLLKGKEVFTGLDEKTHNVTDYSSAFQEKDYREYIFGENTVTITSDGSTATATRTGGKYEATEKSGADGKNAVYDLTVNLKDAKALDGYAINKENGKLEIKKRSVSITSSGEQTYGDSTYTSWSDKKSGFANDDENTFTYEHGIKSGSNYETNLNKTTGRTTAYAGEYKDSVSYSNPTISGKKNVDGTDDTDFFNENYTLDTTKSKGSITVKKADLTLSLKDVSTTYGQEFEPKNYGYKKDAADLKGLTNGDSTAAITDVLQDSDFTYVNGGVKSDPNNGNVKTRNAGSYQITGTTSKTLDNYNIKVVNPGNSTVEKAKLTLNVGNVETTYGTSFDPKTYSYTLAGNTNGDTVDFVKENGITVAYTNTGAITDAASNAKNIYTKDANGDYQLLGDFTLTGQTAKNYEIETNTPGKATVNKATVKVKLNDVSTTYGTAFDTSKYGYDASNIKGLTNGDGTDVVTSVLNGTYGKGNITYTNTGDASEAEKQAGKVTKTVNGGPYYLKGTTSQTLNNYNIEIEDGNATINKATLHLSTGDYKEAYGAAGAVQKDLDNATTVKGEKNGDSLAELTSKIGITNTSGALVSKDRTNDVKYKADGSLDSYGITTEFNKSLDNYNVVLDKKGSVTLKPVAIKVTNDMIQTYGSDKTTFTESSSPKLPNGDTISTDGLTMKPKAGGVYETNRAGRTTADAGIYKDDLAFSGGGIVHEDGTTEASKNYNVTIKGDIIVNKADLHVNTKDVTTPFGTVKFTTSGVQGLTNGDEKNVSDLKFNYGSYGNAYLDNNSYTNAPGRYEFTTETTNQYLDFLKNYNILGGDATVTITPVERPVKPDITPDRPTPIPEGKGTVNEPSIREFRGAEDHDNGGRTWYREKKSIPFFKVLDGKVTNYGTFDVESMPEKVEITPSGMRLPEPDQEKTQHREYTTTLTLPGGEGTYRLVYNGVSFNIHAVDAAARQLLEAGDPKKNEELSEAALHTGFQKMGLGLEDLKAVYVRFN